MAYNEDGYVSAMRGSRGTMFADPVHRFQISRMKRFRTGMINYQPTSMLDLFDADGMANKICSLKSHDATRCGFKLKTRDDNFDEDREEALFSVLDDLQVLDKLAQAESLARATGGAIIHMVCEDGGAASEEEPLNTGSLKRVIRLDVYDRTRVFFDTSYLNSDPSDPNYGQLEFLSIVNVFGHSFLCHASRVLFFTGLDCSVKMRSTQGQYKWGNSELALIEDELANSQSSLGLSLMALGKVSQSVMKLGGLNSKLMLGNEGEAMITRRVNAIDMVRSMMNTIVLDKESDDYSQESTNLTNIKDIIQELENGLAAVAQYPVSMLFSRSNTGLNSSGKNDLDLETYYNHVQHIQNNSIKPNLCQLLSVLNLCAEYDLQLPDKYHIKFKPLYQEDESVEADIESKKALALMNTANGIKTLQSVGALDVVEIRTYLKNNSPFEIDDVEPPEPDAPTPPGYDPTATQKLQPPVPAK